MLVLNCKKVEKESEFIMKRLNQKGFTLIELLAVITIMAILMLVAIPAVARTIDNTRRDTFANVAGTYLSAVRNAVIADELKCGSGDTSVSAVVDGLYYYVIDSVSDADLMETGGKSPWGNAEVKGYVKWLKQGSKISYSVLLVDSGNHGMDTEAAESGLGRSSIKNPTATNKYDTATTTPSSVTIEAVTYTPVACTLK